MDWMDEGELGQQRSRRLCSRSCGRSPRERVDEVAPGGTSLKYMPLVARDDPALWVERDGALEVPRSGARDRTDSQPAMTSDGELL